MIKFFRHIRKQLIAGGQTRKYLKYALGEVILVMIGILLALQVNNWNEKRKLRQTQSIYLKGLKQNLLDSRKELDRVIEESMVTVSALNNLVNEVRKSDTQMSHQDIDSLLMYGMSYTKFQSRQGVIDELISSGQVSIIDNDYLRSEIASWDGNLINIREVEEMGKKGFYDYAERLGAYFDFSGLTPQSEIFENQLLSNFFKDLKTRNTIANNRETSRRLSAAYEDKRRHVDTLIQVINQELKIDD